MFTDSFTAFVSSSGNLEFSAAINGAEAGFAASRERQFAVEILLEVTFHPPSSLACFKDKAKRRTVAYGDRFEPVVDVLVRIEAAFSKLEKKFDKDCDAYAAALQNLEDRTWHFLWWSWPPSDEPPPEPVPVLENPLTIFLLGPRFAGKTSWLWLLLLAAAGKWLPPGHDVGVRFLPPQHEEGGTQRRMEVPPIAKQIGPVRILCIDTKGTTATTTARGATTAADGAVTPASRTPLKGYEPDNPFHVLVLVAPAKRLQGRGISAEAAQAELRDLMGDNTPDVVLATKFDDYLRDNESTSPSRIVGDMNAVSHRWWDAKTWARKYQTSVVLPVLGEDVAVFPIDTPVQKHDSDKDPRNLDPRALGFMFDRAVDSFEGVLRAAEGRVKKAAKKAGVRT